jgi:cell division septal protein FtsQ
VVKKRKSTNKAAARAKRRSKSARPGWIVMALLIGSVAAYAVVTRGVPRIKGLITSMGSMPIKSIIVQGTEQVNGDKVLTAAGIMAGVCIDHAQLDSLKNAFLKNPWVDKVEVSRWAGKVMVSVVERKPIVLVSVGRVYQMDRGGVLLPLPAGEYLNAPIVCGLADTVDANGVRHIRRYQLEAFLAFWDALASQDPPWRRNLAQADFSRPGSVRITLEAHSAIIELGRDSYETKINQVSQLLETMRAERAPQPRTIDLRYENLAFVE